MALGTYCQRYLVVAVALFIFGFGPRAVIGHNASLSLRQTNPDGIVDLQTMPSCESSYCWGGETIFVDTICPPIGTVCEFTDDTCWQQYDRDCYCSLQKGLYCAWPCDWLVWWDVEDWFAEHCPSSPAVTLDFAGLPACARECFEDAVFETGCITQSSNCFCAWGELFECHNHCGTSEEWSQIEDWLQEVCSIDTRSARSAMQDGSPIINFLDFAGTPTSTPPPRVSNTPMSSRWQASWDEVYIFVVLGITGNVILGLWIYSCVAARKATFGNESPRVSQVPPT
ncbi:hypothetical protein S40285_10680 [Stachybotrys chlorohalonatus IBT 40285]|uniref:CFEM domain-containing protein n=1 Tax=Stachybotrys chlorohalonatus (strain IBT 40285) TaxID=1283841 RepID=A0A084QPJ8_STAC4|nr:hypothetical protein S40285_10680 [Stachybotrys chlorohalonata IBT 40285]